MKPATAPAHQLPNNKGALLPHHQSSSRREKGFSLLELLIVLGMIGAIAGAILPNLSLTSGSQISLALREFSLTLRNTYDSAILEGRIHRVVIQVKKGIYWAEQAPLGYEGRPPMAVNDEQAAENDARARLLEDLNQAAADPRKAADGKREYTQRSILVLRRNVLSPIKWNEVDDAVLYKRALPGAVAFASIYTPAMEKKAEFATAGEEDLAFVYFFPSGEALPAAIQFGIQGSENAINDAGPKFTIKLDSLTGHSEILEGFVEVDFKSDDK